MTSTCNKNPHHKTEKLTTQALQHGLITKLHKETLRQHTQDQTMRNDKEKKRIP